MGCSRGINKEIALKQDLKNVTLNLNPIYFDLINARVKVLEGRLNDEKRQCFNIGDIITFFREPQKQEVVEETIVDKYF